MRFGDILRTALTQIRSNKLRSFFTLLGIIVSVGFLVAVIAVIQGMNAYVKENIADAMVGSNAFQVRRTPLNFALIEDDEWRRIQRRPKISRADAEIVRAALPDAEAIAVSSGWPTPQSDVVWGSRTLGSVLILGVTPEYQLTLDYRFAGGDPLNDVDVRDRRNVIVIGADVTSKLFDGADPIGREVRIRGRPFIVGGIVAAKGRVLGQSFDGFAMMPISTFESIYGRRQTTSLSVKMHAPAEIAPAMARAREAMRLAHRLRPTEEDDFSVETADALVDFWKQITKVLFSIVPAMVAIGIVVGGIVVMNIMLMTVRERTHEIGIRKALGATRGDIARQFLAEATALATLGGAIGAGAGWVLALLVAAASPLPARVTTWSVLLAIALGTTVGIVFGVYPAMRAARLEPVQAMRAE
jgi:putative ABC transport system permease protein